MQKEILLQMIWEQIAVQGLLSVSKSPTHTIISPTDQLDLLKKIDCAIQQNESSEGINQHLEKYKDIYQGQQTICNMVDRVGKNAAGTFFYLPALPNDLTLDQDFSVQPPHEGDGALVEIDMETLVETLTDGPAQGLHGHDEQQPRGHLKRACRSIALIPKLGLFAMKPSDQNTDIAEPCPTKVKRRPRIEELSESDKSRVREQNRLTAKNIRDRNKTALVSLIERANDLDKQNKSLRNEITFLKGKIQTLRGTHQRAIGVNWHATIPPLP